MRWLAGLAVVVAITAGVAISLLLSDGDEGGRGQVASADRAELLVRRGLRLYAPLAARNPDSVTCRKTAAAYFNCAVRLAGDEPDEALFSGYDLTISIHDPPTALERAFLKRLLSGP